MSGAETARHPVVQRPIGGVEMALPPYTHLQPGQHIAVPQQYIPVAVRGRLWRGAVSLQPQHAAVAPKGVLRLRNLMMKNQLS